MLVPKKQNDLLTEQQEKFLNALFGEAQGNPKMAGEIAGYSANSYPKVLKSLKEEKMINIYEIFEKPMIEILALMEIEGIKIDNKFLKSLSLKFEKKISKIENEVFKISKKKFIKKY